METETIMMGRSVLEMSMEMAMSDQDQAEMKMAMQTKVVKMEIRTEMPMLKV